MNNKYVPKLPALHEGQLKVANPKLVGKFYVQVDDLVKHDLVFNYV
jgi:hypothetical protein